MFERISGWFDRLKVQGREAQATLNQAEERDELDHSHAHEHADGITHVHGHDDHHRDHDHDHDESMPDRA